MANNMFDNSPIVGLPPQPQPDQYFSHGHYAGPSDGQSPNAPVTPFTPNPSIPPTPGSIAGRKRSRGDVLAPEEEIQPDGSLPTPVEEVPTMPQGKPVMGPGMTLIYPDHPSYGLAAGSQSGTWVEESGERKAFQLRQPERPSTSSRKSQRLHTSASDREQNVALNALPPQVREPVTEPLIDEATRTLGISWARMDSSEVLLINQAAYNKFIQNHYPSLKDVTVWFENSALPGYLVVAVNAYSNEKEYYLFSHDLLEGRLVTRDPNDLLTRLQLLPALELAAPGGNIRAETDSATAAQNELNNVLQDSAVETGSLRPPTQEETPRPRGRSAEPRYRYLELLCTAHEMELD